MITLQRLKRYLFSNPSRVHAIALKSQELPLICFRYLFLLNHHLHYAAARFGMDAMGDAFENVGPSRTRPAGPGSPIN